MPRAPSSVLGVIAMFVAGPIGVALTVVVLVFGAASLGLTIGQGADARHIVLDTLGLITGIGGLRAEPRPLVAVLAVPAVISQVTRQAGKTSARGSGKAITASALPAGRRCPDPSCHGPGVHVVSPQYGVPGDGQLKKADAEQYALGAAGIVIVALTAGAFWLS
jgi:hypothetical protein